MNWTDRGPRRRRGAIPLEDPHTMYLAGDIGGTKTVLALFEPAGEELRLVRDAVFKSHDSRTFEEILAGFDAGRDGTALRSACFGVAGPVIEGRCETTNLPWILEEEGLARALKVERVKLLNDLEATAYGMLFIRPEELVALNPGASPRRQGNVAVIAAGTGLGEAMLFWDGQRHHPIASEGGHADFAARNELEAGLLEFLRGLYGGHVSYERVLSGPGFTNIYDFLRDRGHYPESADVAARMKAGDPHAVITEHGLSGDDPLCKATLELFASIYGAEAGNLALRYVAVGGVFVGGGIAPKVLPALKEGVFLRNFLDKGRFAKFVAPIPVSVVTNPRAPLLGAAHFAARK